MQAASSPKHCATRAKSQQQHAYVVKRKLVETHNSQVYAASHFVNDVQRAQDVAVKRNHCNSHAAATDDPGWEFAIATRLCRLPGHPNVVAIHAASRDEGSLHTVMEYCAQGDLYTLLSTKPDMRLPQLEALAVVLDIARGLNYLHSNNIAHRDVSPENILLGDDQEFKICDFGLSTLANTICSGRVGKTLYMAPEIVRGVEYDPVQADIWSLGIVLFLMLTGSPLVSLASDDLPEFLAVQQIGCHGVLRHWQMDGLFSFATIDLLSKMLEIDPSDRFQNTFEILDHPSLIAAAARKGAAAREQRGARATAGNAATGHGENAAL